MKKLILLLFSSSLICCHLIGQNTKPRGLNYGYNQPGDHIMLQLSSDQWLNAPDSISSRQRSVSRGFNAYIMLEKTFKSSPKFSLGFGLGISNSNVFLDKYSIDLKGTAPKLLFQNLDNSDRFKSYKLATTFLELPLELRYSSVPQNKNIGFKAAIGFKIGTLINAHTKGRTLQDKTGRTINEYTEKIASRRYFNTTRISATARAGYGNFSVFGSYALTGLFKENVAPNINLLQIGLTISGL
ncbi:MAG: PorT family protein [Ferruginibacter sp.]|nr:PorT family protein [Ferruginibacter sp.]